MIQFEHVSKSYGKTPVLKDLNFTIPDGQFVVLIGPCLLYTSDAADE